MKKYIEREEDKVEYIWIYVESNIEIVGYMPIYRHIYIYIYKERIMER